MGGIISMDSTINLFTFYLYKHFSDMVLSICHLGDFPETSRFHLTPGLPGVNDAVDDLVIALKSALNAMPLFNDEYRQDSRFRGYRRAV